LNNLIDKEEEEKLKKLSQESFQKLGDICKEILELSIVNRLNMSDIAERIGYASADVIRTKKSEMYEKMG